MKQLYFLVFLLLMGKGAICQVNLNGTEDHVVVFAIGAEKTWMNNAFFDQWTRLNYNKTINDIASLSLDINIVLKLYDLGIYTGLGYPYLTYSVYFGRRLTGLQSNVSSFLNLHIGGLAAQPNVAPVDYVPTADQQGKSLQLRYNTAYIGLSSKNYLNKLHFKKGSGKKAVSYNAGFYANVGYEPWGGDWQYGYTKGSGKGAEFISNRVFGIPNLNKIFFSAGIFFGLGT